MTTEYPDEFVKRLEILWGEGFLSAGGPDEVRETLKGVDVSGRTVLDLGCGAGGPDIVLANDLSAAKVVGVDVEAGLLDRARGYANAAGMNDKIQYRLINPGPLPFADNAFDIVFSKEAIVQIPDKEGLFREVLRVLRPGGVFAESDWLGGENGSLSPEWARFRELTHWTSNLLTAAETVALIEAAGFIHVSSRDRNPWYALEKREEIRRIEGPLRDKLIAAVGKQTYDYWLEVNIANLAAVEAGALRPTHLRAFKA
jgi:ubiquinone/menaquinone biosynthesis C-methylase UbiE